MTCMFGRHQHKSRAQPERSRMRRGVADRCAPAKNCKRCRIIIEFVLIAKTPPRAVRDGLAPIMFTVN